MLGRWKRVIETDGTQAFRGLGVRTGEAEDLHRLRQENRRLRIERNILKKATAFFASSRS